MHAEWVVAVWIAAAIAFVAGFAIGKGRRPRFYCPQPRLHFGIGPIERKETMLNLNLTNEQKVLVTVTPKTAGGRPASLDGPVQFTVREGNCTIEAVDDRSCKIVSSDEPGLSVIDVTADADLGEGVVEIADEITVSVAGAQASDLGLSIGTPEPK